MLISNNRMPNATRNNTRCLLLQPEHLSKRGISDKKKRMHKICRIPRNKFCRRRLQSWGMAQMRKRNGKRARTRLTLPRMLQDETATFCPIRPWTWDKSHHNNIGILQMEKPRTDKRSRTVCRRTLPRRYMVGPELEKRRTKRKKNCHNQGIQLLQPAILRMWIQHEQTGIVFAFQPIKYPKTTILAYRIYYLCCTFAATNDINKADY